MYTEATGSLIDFIEQICPIIYYPNGLDIETVRIMIEHNYPTLNNMNKRYLFSNILLSELCMNDNNILTNYLHDLNERVNIEVELCKNNSIKFTDTIIYMYERNKDYTECLFTDLDYDTELHNLKYSFKYYGNTLTIKNFINICDKLDIKYEFNDLLKLPINNKNLCVPLIGKNININNIVSNYFLNALLNNLLKDKQFKFNKIIVFKDCYEFINHNSYNNLLGVCEKVIDLKYSLNLILNFIENNKSSIKGF